MRQEICAYTWSKFVLLVEAQFFLSFPGSTTVLLRKKIYASVRSKYLFLKEAQIFFRFHEAQLDEAKTESQTKTLKNTIEIPKMCREK